MSHRRRVEIDEQSAMRALLLPTAVIERREEKTKRVSLTYSATSSTGE